MAGDPFLSDPNRKRKRANQAGRNSQSKASSKPKLNGKSRQSVSRNDEEIPSGEDSESEGGMESDADSEIEDDARNEDELDSDEEFEGENEADKRRRLAKQYLDNLKSGELSDEEGYDAQDLDDDIVARRLQVDVAEQKGHIYKLYGDKISLQTEDSIKVVTTRIGARNLTSMAVKHPNLYTVSKDCQIIKWNINGKPQRIKHTKGGIKFKKLNNDQPHKNHHYDEITCVAVSSDGKYVVTGGVDSRLIIWSSENLACLKVLSTRTAVNSIVFRRNTDQLYAACADLRIRTYSINQYTQLEILYGHQDNITDISALARETCVSVGSRDKTAMFWKISEETRLTFRGGDHERKKKKNDDIATPFYNEGSIEVVSMNDESHFVTGSDNGNISLWSLAKKKPLFVQRLGHGLQPQVAPSTASAEKSEEIAKLQVPQAEPYWITAVHSVAFSDVFITGSSNGSVKIWKIGHDGFRNFSLIGEISNIKGYVVKIESVEIPNENKLSIFVLTGKEHKFGRWFDKVEGSRNALISFTVDI
jgi:ribosomal RNA-processing protein 9